MSQFVDDTKLGGLAKRPEVVMTSTQTWTNWRNGVEGTTGSPTGLSSTGPVPGEEQPCTSLYVGDSPSVKHLATEKDLGVLLITQVEHELAICP